jgi:hypothetical protein
MWGTAAGSLAVSDCLSSTRVVGGQRPYEDRYSFSGAAGQQVALSLSSSAFDTYLLLIAPGGAVVAQDDDGGTGANSRIPAVSGVFTLPVTGVYSIGVTSYSPGSTGAYSVSLMGSLSLTVSPATATGSCSAVKGTVNLGTAAPAGGLLLSVSDTLAGATMPATVTVPAGASKVAFDITTTVVNAIQNGTVSASYRLPDGVSASDSLKLQPILLKSFVLSPDVVKGGNNSTGTLTLVCAAGPGGITVALSSTKPAAAAPAVASVTIPAGSTTATVTVNSFAVTAATAATIKATTGGKSKSDKLTVNPR